VDDYPGLLRVISWVLNGLGMRVQRAHLRTTEQSTAHDEFWLTDLRGAKLSGEAAAAVAERVTDFVQRCGPSAAADAALDFVCGNISVSNGAHARYTLVTVAGEPARHGFLLEIVSAVSGVGLTIKEAVIESAAPGPSSAPPVGSAAAAAAAVSAAAAAGTFNRVFKFWVTDAKGAKLVRVRCCCCCAAAAAAATAAALFLPHNHPR